MFTILLLITINFSSVRSADQGSTIRATDKYDQSKKEDNFRFENLLTSKPASWSYIRDYGWTVYTTGIPEHSPHQFGLINNAFNGNNKTIQFPSTTLNYVRNNMPRSEESKRNNTISEFTLEQLANYSHPTQSTQKTLKRQQNYNAINSKDNNSQNRKVMPLVNSSDIVRRRENSRKHNSLPLYKIDRLVSFTKSHSQAEGEMRPNKSNQLIRDTSLMYPNSTISRRGDPKIYRQNSRYTESMLKPSTDLKIVVGSLISDNNKTDSIKKIPLVLYNSSMSNREDGKSYNPVSSNILGINSKRDNRVRKSSDSTKRCIILPGGKKRRCRRKVKRLNLESRFKPLPEKNIYLLEIDTKDLSKELNGLKNLDKGIKADFKEQEIYLETGTDDNTYLKQNDRSDLPCICHYNPLNCGCDCEGSLNYDNFMNLSLLFRHCKNFTFTMKDGHFYALPPNLFYNVKSVDNFHIYIKNSSFEYLLDPTPMTSAFTGVHFHHHALVNLNNVTVRRRWNWSPFQKLKGAPGAFVDVIVEDSVLKRLTSDFSSFANGQVESIDVADSSLEMVGSAAFQTFVNLTSFRVPNNKISYLHRMDFPEICLKLQEIDLRNNQLHNLEDGFFAAMPSLKEVKLSGNPLKMLSEKTFQEVINRVNLQGISGFPLTCNCHLQWLKSSKMEDNNMIKENMNGATCRRPGHLRGTPFKSLSKEHLVC